MINENKKLRWRTTAMKVAEGKTLLGDAIIFNDEVAKAQLLNGSKPPRPDVRYIDMSKEKPIIKVSTKVLVSIKEHSKFNFVSKLPGQKNNSLKRLREKPMTGMAILGRGSMRDRMKRFERFKKLFSSWFKKCSNLTTVIIIWQDSNLCLYRDPIQNTIRECSTGDLRGVPGAYDVTLPHVDKEEKLCRYFEGLNQFFNV